MLKTFIHLSNIASLGILTIYILVLCFRFWKAGRKVVIKIADQLFLLVMTMFHLIILVDSLFMPFKFKFHLYCIITGLVLIGFYGINCWNFYRVRTKKIIWSEAMTVCINMYVFDILIFMLGEMAFLR